MKFPVVNAGADPGFLEGGVRPGTKYLIEHIYYDRSMTVLTITMS